MGEAHRNCAFVPKNQGPPKTPTSLEILIHNEKVKYREIDATSFLAAYGVTKMYPYLR